MTEQQIERIQKLSKKIRLSEENPENTLLFIGVGYNLIDQQIEAYLRMENATLLDKHLGMLCQILHIEDSSMGNKGMDGKPKDTNPAERLDALLKKHYVHAKRPEIPYGNIMQYILNASNLSAAQIEQLRLAVKAGVPEEEVLKLAQGNKEPMEIKRCVEFFQMLSSNENSRIGKKGRFIGNLLKGD